MRVTAVDPGWCRTDRGGEAAPRSANAGALSILHAVFGDAGVIGTGALYNSAGAKVPF